ncbi:hypothetical protein BGX28_000618 [Mortierella sp. GBA30]|nr:hypothetical protein BGX28_000618 [Mortierella sp. GBA30]
MAPSIPNPWAEPGRGFPPLFLQELSMIAASSAVREKPNWWQKYKDPIISSRWRKEIMDAGIARGEGYELSEEHVDYIFEELRWYAEKRQDQIDNGVQAPIEIAIDGTRRSDGLIPQPLKARLLSCVRKLRDVPDHMKDWHPGSNKQVLDLVHPSLYPFVAGRTRVVQEDATPPLDFICQGQVMDYPPNTNDNFVHYFSEKYQWLPTDFEVGPDGKVKIISYINNLHPVEHQGMYPVLEEIFELFVPMFEEVLADVCAMEFKASRLTNGESWYGSCGWYGEEPLFETDEEYEAYERERVPLPVCIPEFEPRRNPPKYDLRTGDMLQVIVKLADIHLTPENPKYNGGSWHVEGMSNENIVATGIYYYHSENIRESRLNFRVQVAEPDYLQNDDKGVKFMYGLANNEPLVQHLDGVLTKQDRCIVFPNIYQHQVQPFELEDPIKPGIRSILVFFLIDPARPILSTTNVPPQQYDWALKEILLKDAEENLVDWPMKLDEAKMHREELMKERKYIFDDMSEEGFERPFSLCEH